MTELTPDQVRFLVQLLVQWGMPAAQDLRRRLTKKSDPQRPGWLGKALPQSQILSKFVAYHNQITLRVHDDHGLHCDDITKREFEELNIRRDSRGLRTYNARKVYRLVRPPSFSDSKVLFDLCPISFAHFAVTTDDSCSESIRTHVRRQVEDLSGSISEEMPSDHPQINAMNLVPLGLEITLLTSDKKTLLRRRGRQVLVARDEWDTSYSGYCEGSEQEGDQVIISSTAASELHEEVSLRANTARLVFTALHMNSATGATDITGFWPIDATGDDVAAVLNRDVADKCRVFETSERAREEYTQDYKNIVIPFDASEMRQILRALGTSPTALLPEALTSVIMAQLTVGTESCFAYNNA